jgi:hypothetical protein
MIELSMIHLYYRYSIHTKEGEGQYMLGEGPTVCIGFLNSTCSNFGQSNLNDPPSSTAGIGTGIYTISQVRCIRVAFVSISNRR